MKIALARTEEQGQVERYDRHIPGERLRFCIENSLVYVLKEGGSVIGILRYSLFWQTIPFLDLLYLDEQARGRGFGRQLMAYWEREMQRAGFDGVMTSTQADETAQFFYEKTGYRKIGSFLPPGQEAEELIYWKGWKRENESTFSDTGNSL